MSSYYTEVVQLGPITKHPNADTLSITEVNGNTVICKTGDFAEGDIVGYVSEDAIMPDRPEFSFLQSRRIKAKKLRGIFSQGLLFKLDPTKEWAIGDDVAEFYGISKHDPEAALEHKAFNTDTGPSPKLRINKYDLESLKKYKHVLQPTEWFVVTEKIHGCNARFVWHDNKLWVGSRTRWLKETPGNIWWIAATQYELNKKLQAYPDTVFFAELYGQVQDLKYNGGLNLAFFDVYDTKAQGRSGFHNYGTFKFMCNWLNLPTVPELYEGPWVDYDTVKQFANGKSTVKGANCIREGIVIKPTTERTFGANKLRVIFKLHGEDFLLRKE